MSELIAYKLIKSNNKSGINIIWEIKRIDNIEIAFHCNKNLCNWTDGRQSFTKKIQDAGCCTAWDKYFWYSLKYRFY